MELHVQGSNHQPSDWRATAPPLSHSLPQFYSRYTVEYTFMLATVAASTPAEIHSMKAYSINLTLAPVRIACYSLSQSCVDSVLLSVNYKTKKIHFYKTTHQFSSANKSG